MKNIFKYSALTLFGAMLLVSCEGFVDFERTVETPGRMAYLDAGADNTVNATITHSPAGSFFDLGESFKVALNSTMGADVRLAADNSLVAAYNEEHSTEYATLPQESIVIEPVAIARETTYTAVSSQLTVSGDLASLKDAKGYLVPIRIRSASNAEVSEAKGTVYMIVTVGSGNIRPVSSAADIFATPIADRTGWSVDQPTGGESMFDGSATSYATIPSAPYTQVIDLGTSQSFDGIRLMVWGTGTALPNVQVETGSNGTDFTDAGVAGNTKYVTRSDASGRVYQYIMLYKGVDARYVRLTTSVWSTNRRICEFDLLKTDTSAGVIYTNATEFSGAVNHTPGGSTVDLSAEFGVSTIVPSTSGYSVSVAVDNSLVAAYNTENGTSYVAMPSSSVSIENPTVQIAGMKYASTSKVKVSLQEVSSLNDPNGYLIPLKLSSQAGVIAGKDVVYVKVTAEDNMLVRNPVAINVTGLPVSDRSAWTVDVDGNEVTTITDDSNTTYAQAPGTVTVTMDKEYTVSVLKLFNYNAAANIPVVKVEYGTNGTAYTTAGTADASRYFVGGQNQYIVFTEPVAAKYIKLTLRYSSTSNNNRLYDFTVYETKGSTPLVYASANTAPISGSTIFHSPFESIGNPYGQFFPTLTMPASKDVEVRILQDNTLVAAYNEAHGTSYGTVPTGNVEIANASLSIPAGKFFNTASAVSISFTGNLSSLDDLTNGYLIPLKVSSDAGTVADRSVVYYVVAADYSNMLLAPDQAKIFGVQLARTGWTAIINDAASTAVTDNSTGTYIANARTIEVDMTAPQWLSGIRLDNSQTNATYHPATLRIEYSMDGTSWEYAGVAGTDRRYQTGNNSYYMFYTPINARYFRLSPTYSTAGNTNNRIREVYAYDAQGAEPKVFLSGGSNAAGGAIVSTLSGGTITHTPVDTQSSVAAVITTYLSAYHTADITATAAVDNSLVAAYNAANSRNYSTIPVDNIVIGNSSQLIREGFAQSLTTITVSLRGNLSALRDLTNGYVIPVKISTEGGVGVDEAHSVVYVTVNAEESNIKSNPTANDLTGTLLAKTGWSCTIANLIDGATNAYTTNPGAFTITMPDTRSISAIRMYQRNNQATYAAQPTIEYSTDGVNYSSAGRAVTGKFYYSGNYQHILFYLPIECRYVRITPNYTNTGARLYEVDFYSVQ